MSIWLGLGLGLLCVASGMVPFLDGSWMVPGCFFARPRQPLELRVEQSPVSEVWKCENEYDPEQP